MLMDFYVVGLSLNTIHAPKGGQGAWPRRGPFLAIGSAERAAQIVRILFSFAKRPFYLFEINLQSMEVRKFFTIPLALRSNQPTVRGSSRFFFQTLISQKKPQIFHEINPQTKPSLRQFTK
jgi:hypothetical protein